jgi:hypothetical protein
MTLKGFGIGVLILLTVLAFPLTLVIWIGEISDNRGRHWIPLLVIGAIWMLVILFRPRSK